MRSLVKRFMLSFILAVPLFVMCVGAVAVVTAIAAETGARDGLELSTFSVDVTPPVGQPVGLGFVPPAETVEHPLLAKGVILQDGGGTYVLCAIDWMEVHNDSYDTLRLQIAEAADTTVSRVALHCLHQHTAPAIDVNAQRLQLAEGDPRRIATQQYEFDVSRKIAAAIRTAVDWMRPVDQIGTSSAKVDRVASNRRLEGENGSITVRSSSTQDAALHAAPEGLIDPMLRTLSFCHDGKPQLQIHYYATHPQSYYGDGRISYDTVGIARERLQRDTGVFQLYFTGCGGDVAMGKYNDGTHAARAALTNRIHDAMRRSVAHVKLAAVAPVRWQTIDLRFPPRRDTAFSEETCRRVLANDKAPFADRLKAAFNLAWIQRVAAEDAVELSCLSIGDVRMLHLPGEPFVQYQLAAQRLRPESFVLVAGYGDCGMSYIGGDRIYQDRGGYEQTFAFAGPSEQLLLDAVDRLLDGRGNDR